MQNDDYASAETLLLQSLKRAKDVGSSSAEMFTRYHLGRTYYFSEKAAKAIDQFAIVLRWAEGTRNDDLEAETRKMIGMSQAKLGNKAAAVEELDRALLKLDAQGRPGAFLCSGRLQWEMGQNADSRKRILQAIEGFLANHDHLNAANALRMNCTVAESDGDYGEELKAAQRGIELLEALTSGTTASKQAALLMSDAMNTQISTLFKLHRPEDAMRAAERAHAFYHKQPNAPKEGELEGIIGSYYLETGNEIQARGYFLESANKFDLAGKKAMATAARRRAITVHGENELITPQKLKELGRQIEESDDQEKKASLLSRRGDLLRQGTSKSNQSLAILDLEQAYAIYSRLLDVAGGSKAPTLRMNFLVNQCFGCLHSLAMTQFYTGDLAGSRESRRLMASLAQRPGLNQDVNLLIYKSILLLDWAFHDDDRMRADLDSATPGALKLHDHQTLSFLSTLRGQLCDRAKDPENALKNYRIAIAELEKGSDGAEVPQLRDRHNERESLDPYAAAIRILVMRGAIDEAFNLSERARSQAFLEEVQAQGNRTHQGQKLEAEARLLRQKLNELGNEQRSRKAGASDEAAAAHETLRHEYDNLLLRMKMADSPKGWATSAKPCTAADVCSRLGAKHTLLSYQPVDIGLVVFIATHEGITFAFSPALDYEIEKLMVECEDSDLHQEASSKLYNLLVRPAGPMIRDSKVTIAPYGALRGLSFAMLSPDGEHFMGDEHPLDYTPSASALAMRPRGPQHPGSQALIMENSDGGQQFGTLATAREEAQQIAGLYNVRPLLEVTRLQFTSKAPGANLLHIASHGEMNPDHPDQAKLILKPADGNDGSLYLADIRSLDLRGTALVTISACQGAKGTGMGDGLSIQNAFLFAGARNVIAPLWTVDDAVSHDLMLNLHQQIRRGASYGEALRQAQIETRRAHPKSRDWAAFILMGASGED